MVLFGWMVQGIGSVLRDFHGTKGWASVLLLLLLVEELVALTGVSMSDRKGVCIFCWNCKITKQSTTSRINTRRRYRALIVVTRLGYCFLSDVAVLEPEGYGRLDNAAILHCRNFLKKFGIP